MAERRTAVQTYQLDLLCDACGAAMEKTGNRFNGKFLGRASAAVQHEHTCSACGAVQWAEREYPVVVHELVDGLT